MSDFLPRETINAKLPPLILHPFSDSSSPGKLIQGSRASLMLQGLLPTEQLSFEELETLLIAGKVCEIRMLYYVGKDIIRWLDQCVGTVGTLPSGEPADVRTFAAYLIEETPAPVSEKLYQWGVKDYRSIFSRAIGFNSVFGEAPDKEQLSDEFIRGYHYYADQLYRAWQLVQPFPRLQHREFDFELYASAEYSRLLERQWAEAD